METITRRFAALLLALAPCAGAAGISLETLKLPNGGVLSRDAGAITILDTSNADGSFRSSTLAGESGPHPDFDSGFTLACDVIVPALT